MCCGADSDECEWEGACAQRCSNLPGSYACACAAGYVLRADQRSCAAVNGHHHCVILTFKSSFSQKKKSFIVIFIITKSNLRFFELNLSTDPVGAPLSLIVATESGVERVWPAAPAAAARGNYSLAALDVRAIDFLYSNRCVTPAYSAARSGPCRTYATELTRRVSVCAGACATCTAT